MEYYEQFYNYNNMDLRRYHKQKFRDGKLNRHCEHVIRNGEPVTLTLEQREQFIRNICDIPDNPISLGVFCGMAVYACTTWLLPVFLFAIASVFTQENKNLAFLLYAAGIILLLLILAGFIGLCILITRKNKKRAVSFRTEASEKIRRGDYRAYVYQIDEVFRVLSYNEDIYGGYLYFWYRVRDVIFELPNTTFAYKLGKHDEILYENPEEVESNECSHPVGGYITGMLIHLDGKERFYGM